MRIEATHANGERAPRRLSCSRLAATAEIVIAVIRRNLRPALREARKLRYLAGSGKHTASHAGGIGDRRSATLA
jgi:hypothetical protein